MLEFAAALATLISSAFAVLRRVARWLIGTGGGNTAERRQRRSDEIWQRLENLHQRPKEWAVRWVFVPMDPVPGSREDLADGAPWRNLTPIMPDSVGFPLDDLQILPDGFQGVGRFGSVYVSDDGSIGMSKSWPGDDDIALDLVANDIKRMLDTAIDAHGDGVKGLLTVGVCNTGERGFVDAPANEHFYPQRSTRPVSPGWRFTALVQLDPEGIIAFSDAFYRKILREAGIQPPLRV